MSYRNKNIIHVILLLCDASVLVQGIRFSRASLTGVSGSASSFPSVQVVTLPAVPRSPCPNVFQYYVQPNGDVYGKINIPYEGSSNLYLGVNASMKGYYNDNNLIKLKIKLNTPGRDLIERRSNSLSYDIYFPLQNAIPRITRIDYNQKVYCSGPPEELFPGSPGVTNIWSGHTYYFQPANPGSSLMPSYERPGSQPDYFEMNNRPIERFPELNENSFPEVTSTTEKPLPHPVLTNVQSSFECGVVKHGVVPLIFGGNEITDGMFPWLAAMFTASGNGYNYKCTANLISDQHVVTAARCVSFFKIQVVQLEDILFIFGKSNLKNWAASGAVTRGAAAIHTNPDFNANSGHGDISVIKLDKPVQFSSSIIPICLWDGDNSLQDIVDKMGTVAGWGADEVGQKNGKFSISVAKSVDMPVVSQDGCLFSNFSYFQLTSDLTFCAGKRDGTGTCIGDSGAGFMMKKNGKFYLRGLASLVLSDHGKCDLTNYMVFCDAAKLTSWIKDAMVK